MTEVERLGRTEAADALCRRAFVGAGCPDGGVALVAVGGYGRRELAPYSDLDLVLVHDAAVEPGPWAAELWYPLWDSGVAVDHAVRSPDQLVDLVAADLRVALSVLDLRHVAGDARLAQRVRSAVLSHWRREARVRLDELRALVDSRAELVGELAHAAVPDLKESAGGLRDATVLKALVAAWLADVPHAELRACHRRLLDVRDALHDTTGRRGDRVAPEVWPDLATRLGFTDGIAAQRHVRGLGRHISRVSRSTWRRAGAVRKPATSGVRRPALVRLRNGVAAADGEVVLDAAPGSSSDTGLLLSCAVEAAERGLLLSPVTAARLARAAGPLPEPWPEQVRALFLRLLGAGPGLPAVWEVLEETGALDSVLPEWSKVRLLPHASAVHRFTVDRHLLQTCVEAAALARRVARPEVLLVAALLHDIGKGSHGDHSHVGAQVAEGVARRMGLPDADVALVARLVRHHLLLSEAATTRDPDDPATMRLVTSAVGDRTELELLAALTEADARATADQAWTRWRAVLVGRLVERCAHALPGPAGTLEGRS